MSTTFPMAKRIEDASVMLWRVMLGQTTSGASSDTTRSWSESPDSVPFCFWARVVYTVSVRGIAVCTPLTAVTSVATFLILQLGSRGSWGCLAMQCVADKLVEPQRWASH